ncbi:hypothetical protein SSX86_019226 [Deinandra increscens subsp. villosa]|uniref:Uncharacterized protein n=1 Tax=Deinandra increscens subsp. villosa TaxID=3103831 RepID=A0AAP0CXI4_9ASTR
MAHGVCKNYKLFRTLPFEGSPSRNSRWPRETQSQGGGLEIVFNQQLTRLGYYLISCVIAPSAKIPSTSLPPLLLCTLNLFPLISST